MEADIRIGKFTIVRRLGRGGMGAVYEGYDPALDRRVAIKTLTTDVIADKDSRSRFEREARAAAKLQHPNIVTIYELGNFGGKEKPYIVMEYLEGTDVATLIGDRGIPFAESLDITAQLLRALDFAHQHGIVHRDVKPANVRYLDNGQVKIMDFGIARMEGSAQITKSGVMVGTLHYMSPEQIKGKPVDGRTDIFSAGCILYEMLTAQRPFPGDTATAILYRIVHDQPEPIATKNSEFPQEIQDLLDRALAKPAEERFSTAGEMAREIDKLLTVHRKTLPRTSANIQSNLDELEKMAREQRWRELVPRAQQLLQQHPQLELPHRLVRRATRELRTMEQAAQRTAEEQTQHLAEIQEEITHMFPPTRVPATARDVHLEAETKASSGTGEHPGGSSSSLWMGLLALLAVAAGVIGWFFLQGPSEPTIQEHTLVIRSNPPGAEVFVDGQSTGLFTSEAGTELPIGGLPNESRLVELRADGFDPAQRRIVIAETAPGPIELSLNRSLARMRLVTEPAAATVVVDGETLDDVTPVTLALSPTDAHDIVLTKRNYISRTLRLAAGEDLPAEPVVLRPVAGPGTLRVESTYPVSIRRAGTTLAPATAAPSVQLRPGRHELTLVASSVFLVRTYEVDITEGQTTVISTPSLGRVSVRANPGNCELTVDGIAAEAPPIMNKPIVAGNHEFVFTWPNGRRDVQRLRVEPNKPSYVTGEMR